MRGDAEAPAAAPQHKHPGETPSTPQFMGVTVCGVDYNGL